MDIKSYTFVKNTRGALSITLESYDMMLPTKTFFIPHNADSIVIPHQYALGLFISDSALKQLQMGYFKVKDMDSLSQEGTELGLVASVDTEDTLTYSIKDVENALKTNDVEYIKVALDSKSKLLTDNIMMLANEHYSELNNQMVHLIEDVCGVELKIDE